MKGFLALPRQDVLLAVAVMLLVGGRVVGQTQGGDEPVFTPSGGPTSLMGPSPRQGEQSSAICPEPADSSGPPRTDHSQGHSNLGHKSFHCDRPDRMLQAAISPPQPEPITPSTGELYGTLEIPAGAEDDGPETASRSMRPSTSTLERSLDLRSKFYEIPQARADILQASLRANPVFYHDGQLLRILAPFQPVRSGRPDSVRHEYHLIARRLAQTPGPTPLSPSAPRRFSRPSIRRRSGSGSTTSTTLTSWALWRRARRFATRRRSVKGLESLATTTEQLYRGKGASLGDLNRVRIQVRRATLGQIDAEAAYRKARLDLGSLMNLTRGNRGARSSAGSISDTAPPPPAIEAAAEACPGRTPRHRLVPAGRRRAPRPTCGWPGPIASVTSSCSFSRIPTRITHRTG